MEFIPVSRPTLSDLEQRYVRDALESTWISSSGEYLDRFEPMFAEFCSADYALGVTNGTVALHLALAALGLGQGDEVIVPSLTYVATANAVRYCGAEPVFADVEQTSWGLDLTSVESVVSPRTKAIIAVHLYGQPADMHGLRRLASKHGLALVEDAAEAPGATIEGQRVGSFGDVATFSFYGNKVISSGEGGAVTTSDPALHAKMKLLRGQGMDPERRYWFPVTGFNYRMTNVVAAILCAQMERLPGIFASRLRVFDHYTKRLTGIDGLKLQPTIADRTISPWLYCVLLEHGEGDARDRLAARLDRVGVETRPFFIPLHQMPPFSAAIRSDMSVTVDLAARGLNLPTFPDMTPEQVDYVCASVESILDGSGSLT